MTILESDLSTIVENVQKAEVSAEKVFETFYSQSERLNPKVNAYITLNTAGAEKARQIDLRIKKGEKVGRLAGIPVAAKDMFCTKGLLTTAGSKILHNFIPNYSATVVEKIETAGAVILGKANQDEFAMGSSTESSYYGKSHNPWNLEYVAGGSSGGSAVAVAARMAPAALGTDTGGSIRQPANFCNVVGVKPTYGRVSRFGIVAFASSLDQAGPMVKTVKDAALMMEVMCGADHRDSTTSVREVPSWTQNLNDNLKGVRIGLPKEYFSDSVQSDVQAVMKEALAAVKEAGATVVEVSLPLTNLGVPVYYLIATCEASSNLARYDGVRFGYRADFSKTPAENLEDFYSRTRGEGFGAEVKRRIVMGTYALSSGYYDAYYRKACQVRRLLRQNFIDAFKVCDVLLSPVTSTTAFKLGERVEDPLKMYLNDIYTTSTNLAGTPGMSVPGGFGKNGLPIGVQLSAAHFDEQSMLNVGLAIENRLAKHKEVPSVVR